MKDTTIRGTKRNYGHECPFPDKYCWFQSITCTKRGRLFKACESKRRQNRKASTKEESC